MAKNYLTPRWPRELLKTISSDTTVVLELPEDTNRWLPLVFPPGFFPRAVRIFVSPYIQTALSPEAYREHAVSALEKFDAGGVAMFSENELETVKKILRKTLTGHDARKILDTNRPGQKVKEPPAAQYYIAVEYLRRLQIFESSLEKEVAHDVATTWKVSKGHVRVCAAEYRARHESLSDSELEDRIRNDAELMFFTDDDHDAVAQTRFKFSE